MRKTTVIFRQEKIHLAFETLPYLRKGGKNLNKNFNHFAFHHGMIEA